MKPDQIQHYFAIDRDAQTTLHEQLTRSLQSFIVSHPPETRLPSERQFAEVLGVDRGTVKKVITQFADQGALIRRGRHGTFTAGKQLGDDKLHPMEMQAYFVDAPVKTLRLALYEAHAPLKDFWEATVLAYNQHHHDINILIEWVPALSPDAYPDYLARTSPDLYQIALTDQSQAPRLALPDDLHATLLQTETFHSDHLDARSQAVLSEVVPVHFSIILHAINLNLADQLGLSDVPQALREDPVSVLTNAAQALPPNQTANGNIWDYVLALGAPIRSGPPSRDFFHQRFTELAPLARQPRLFLTRQRYSMESLDRFMHGQMLVYSGHLGLLQRHRDDTPFRLGFCIPRPRTGLELPCDFSGLAVLPSSAHPEHAFAFLRDVVSAPTQRRLANQGICTFRRTETQHTADRYGIDSDAFRAAVETTTNVSCQERHISYFLIFCIRDLLEAFHQGTLDIHQATDLAWERWLNYLNPGSLEDSPPQPLEVTT